MRIGPTTHPAVNAGLHVEAAVGNPVDFDTALVADCGLLDRPGFDSELGSPKIDGNKVGDWTEDEVSWQHRKANNDCIAGRIEFSYKDYDMFGAKGVGKVTEVAG